MSNQKKLTVSVNTTKFINCLKTLQSLNDEVYDSLESFYDSNACERLMAENFRKEYDALEARINGFLLQSISHNIGTLGSNEI